MTTEKLTMVPNLEKEEIRYRPAKCITKHTNTGKDFRLFQLIKN